MNSEQILSKIKDRMNKVIAKFSGELKSVRTGRATTGILDRVRVNYYGTPTPINQVATVNIPEAQLIVIQPWDKSIIEEIEKAILASDIGVNPSNDGNIIRLSMPPLTEESRKELAKVVYQQGEDSKVLIRNIRRDANEEFKELQKNGEISEDDYYREHDHVQKITDEHTERIDKLVNAKKDELMAV